MRKLGVFSILLLWAATSRSQLCVAAGQTPSSAVLVCSSEPYIQPTISFCGEKNVPACNDGFSYTDKNSYWFKLACYIPGTLGFTISPFSGDQNFDWVLFDFSNRNPDDVFTDGSLYLASNFSTDPGETGASSDGTSLTVCYGSNPTFSSMPNLIQGHQYLLMVRKADNSPEGFTLAVEHGTASITDPVLPQLASSVISCDGTKVIVKLNREIRCSTIAADGSDFTISGGYLVTSASSVACTGHALTDTLTLGINAPLPLGNYTLTLQTGTDGNTLMDNCNRSVPAGATIPLVVTPPQPTLMDSVTRPACAPRKLRLVFKRALRCSSIAADGSDFSITGPAPVIITGVSTACSGPGTNLPSSTFFIDLNLLVPILSGGTYTIHLNQGSDGNSIIDECGRETPPGGTLNFITPEAVSADFTYTVQPSCRQNSVQFNHTVPAGVTGWNWRFDNVGSSTLQNPVQDFNARGKYVVRLIVTNGTCMDTVSKTLEMDNEVIAAFRASEAICPGDPLVLENNSKGTIDGYEWHFGDGNQSSVLLPAGYHYAAPGIDKVVQLQLIVSNHTIPCNDTASQLIKLVSSCLITVPSAFTPNGDGRNDFLYPLNALQAEHLSFTVYNRYGQVVFTSKSALQKWDGTLQGTKLDTGVYIWLLSYTLPGRSEKILQRGTVLLIR